MSFFDGSPFVLDAVSDRFEVLLRRYHLFAKDIPSKFQQWLKVAPSQKRIFSTLESICTEMFPDLMSIASADFPHRWTLPVACVALKHHVTEMHMKLLIELSECGRALRVLDDAPPKQAPVFDSKDLSVLRNSLFDSMCAASRTAELEVKVAELECRSKGLLPEVKADDRCRKRKQATTVDGPAENVFAYLSECRTEALDALVALRKTHRGVKRHSDKLSAANAEIGRLRAENELLHRQRQLAEPTAPSPASVILPKRALSLAGFWNLSPNDLLSVTPALVQSVQKRGGAVIQRDGMHVCFAAQEQALLVDAAVETMAECLPQYHRRLEF
jgi:hypothetical protein